MPDESTPRGPARPRRWAAIDLELLEDDRISRVTPLQILAYLGCIFYASRQLSDGFVPARMAASIAGQAGTDRRAFAELVDAGLLEQTTGGWIIPGFLDWQPSRAYVEHQRARMRKNTAAYRARINPDVSDDVSDNGSAEESCIDVEVSTKSSSRQRDTKNPPRKRRTSLASQTASQDFPTSSPASPNGAPTAGRVTSGEGASVPVVTGREMSNRSASTSEGGPEPLGDDVRRFLERLRGAGGAS